MRKKLLLFSLLTTISFISFTSEKNFKVRAYVVKPISITATNTSFGNVLAETENFIPGRDGGSSKIGKVYISGEPNKEVNVEIQKTIRLKRIGGEETMNAIIFDGTYSNPGGSDIIINSDGTIDAISFTPSIPKVTSVAGTYVGIGKVNITHEWNYGV